MPEQPFNLPDDYASLAGHTDDTVRDRTGKTWPEWVRALDDIGAMDMSHADIARRVKEQVGQAWWSQTVAVGYERIRGLRDVGQVRDAGYVANKSKTFHAPLDTIFEAFVDDTLRRRWLGVPAHVRGSTPMKSVRMDWPDGTDVVVWLEGRRPERCVVSVQHAKLESGEAKEEAKAFWGERLEALKALVQ